MPVPDREFTRVKYFVEDSFSTSASGTTPLALRFQTSLAAPYMAGGNQPMWVDQLATMYSRYRIHGIKYKFTLVHNASTSITSGFLFAVRQSNDPTIESVWSTICERQGTKTRMLGPPTDKPMVIKGYMPVGKPHGLTKQEMRNDDNFWGTLAPPPGVHTSPPKMSYLMLYGKNQASTAVADFCSGTCELTFLVELGKRVQVAGS